MKHGWLIIVGAALVVYANALDNGFHYDDEHSIQHNIHLHLDLRDIPHIRASLAQMGRYFVDPGMFSVDAQKGMYRPLLLITYGLNYALGGYEVRGYHLVNLLLHTLCALVLSALGRRLSGSREAGLLAGLLFVLHPLASEPVNYISSRSESLAALFYLLSLTLYVRFRQQETRWARDLSLLAMACGLLSKSTVITLPAVLLAYEGMYHRLPGWRVLAARGVRRVLPFLVLDGVYLALIWMNGYLSGAVRTPVRGTVVQALTQVKAVVYYLYLLGMPVQLNVEHQFAAQHGASATVFFSAALVATLFWGGIRAVRRGPALAAFLGALGIMPLLPVLVMPLNVLVNERRIYLSLAVLCLGLALLLVRTLRSRGHGRAQRLRLAGILVLVLAGTTIQRNQAWKDEFSLWRDAVVKAPLMPRVHLYLGNAFKSAAMAAADGDFSRDQWEQARREYQRTLELDPTGDLGLRALNNVGAVSFMLGDIDSAEKAYRRAVELQPRYADAIVNLGSVFHERARRLQANDPARLPLLRKAVSYYESALAIRPNHPLCHANLGLVYADMGDLDRALAAYQRAYRINPADERLLNNMANLFLTLARRSAVDKAHAYLLRAQRLYARSLQLNPAYVSPRNGLRQVQALLAAGK